MNNATAHMLFDESVGAWRLSTNFKDLNEQTPAEEMADAAIPVDFKDHRLISQSLHRAAALSTLPALPTRSAKVPRPPNCFILYRQAHHHIVKEANPGVSNNEICELSPCGSLDLNLTSEQARILGDRWNNERPEIRARYTRLAEDLKREHAIKHPDYQYAPRRPSERKRRASRVNAKALGYVDRDPVYQEALKNSEFIGEEQYIPVDDKLVNMLNDRGLLWGPTGVAPELDNYNQPELISIANDLASENNLASIDGSQFSFDDALDMNIDNQGMLLSGMF
jgi:hypothetical protein